MLTRDPCARSTVDMSLCDDVDRQLSRWTTVMLRQRSLKGLSPFLPSSPPPPSLHSTSHKSELTTPSTHPSALFHHRDWSAHLINPTTPTNSIPLTEYYLSWSWCAKKSELRGACGLWWEGARIRHLRVGGARYRHCADWSTKRKYIWILSDLVACKTK